MHWNLRIYSPPPFFFLFLRKLCLSPPTLSVSRSGGDLHVPLCFDLDRVLSKCHFQTSCMTTKKFLAVMKNIKSHYLQMSCRSLFSLTESLEWMHRLRNPVVKLFFRRVQQYFDLQRSKSPNSSLAFLSLNAPSRAVVSFLWPSLWFMFGDKSSQVTERFRCIKWRGCSFPHQFIFKPTHDLAPTGGWLCVPSP